MIGASVRLYPSKTPIHSYNNLTFYVTQIIINTSPIMNPTITSSELYLAPAAICLNVIGLLYGNSWPCIITVKILKL